jgi:hypothetical protein
LLRRTAQTCAAQRRLAIDRVATGRWVEALCEARRYHAMYPSPDSERLLAIASLGAGDWSTAATIAAR